MSKEPNATFWQAVPIETQATWRMRVGETTLWLYFREDELHVAAEREGPETAAPLPLESVAGSEGDLEWRRWVVGADVDRVRVLPLMPDRGVVVLPELPVTLPPKAKAEFFVRVPLWLRIQVLRGGEEITICDEPAVVLSNTWFGDPMQGELCYSMRTTARRHVEPDSVARHRAICPVTVHNDSSEQLPIERICVRLAHLQIFESDGDLWTGRVNAAFRGTAQASRLSYDHKAPSHAPGARLVMPERKPVQESMLRRTFVNLRSVIP
jgi:hypothetical protein